MSVTHCSLYVFLMTNSCAIVDLVTQRPSYGLLYYHDTMVTFTAGLNTHISHLDSIYSKSEIKFYPRIHTQNLIYLSLRKYNAQGRVSLLIFIPYALFASALSVCIPMICL